MVELKKRMLHQLMAYSCCNGWDYGLYSGNGGIVLILLEMSRELDNKPLNHYAMSLFEKGLCLLQQAAFSPSAIVPDPLLMGWIVTEGHRRKYFDAMDMEEDMEIFDDGLLHKGWISDLPILAGYMINRYRALHATDDGKRGTWLDRLECVIVNVIRGDDSASLVNKWIVYGMLAEMDLPSKILIEYMDWLPDFTMKKVSARECPIEEIYLIRRISSMTPNGTIIKELRFWLQPRLDRIGEMVPELKIRLLERWGVTRCFFYPDVTIGDSYWEDCRREINESDLGNTARERIEGWNIGAKKGLCSLMTII
jgi:hypothetical protein